MRFESFGQIDHSYGGESPVIDGDVVSPFDILDPSDRVDGDDKWRSLIDLADEEVVPASSDRADNNGQEKGIEDLVDKLGCSYHEARRILGLSDDTSGHSQSEHTKEDAVEPVYCGDCGKDISIVGCSHVRSGRDRRYASDHPGFYYRGRKKKKDR